MILGMPLDAWVLLVVAVLPGLLMVVVARSRR